MIIDSRFRPAIPAFQRTTIKLGMRAHNTPAAKYHERFNMGALDPSTIQCSMELCLKEMGQAGITYACVPNRWGFNDAPLVSPEEMIDFINQYPDTFYGTAALSARFVNRSLEIVDKYIINGPLKAATIEPGMEGIYIDDTSLYPLYEHLQGNNIPLFMMTGGCSGPYIKLVNPEHLDTVLCDFPALVIIGAHAGIPYADIDLFVGFRRPNYFLCPDNYLLNSPYTKPYIDAANCMLQDQMLFGTSYPFMPMVEYTRQFLELPIHPEIMDKILWKNITRALNLEF